MQYKKTNIRVSQKRRDHQIARREFMDALLEQLNERQLWKLWHEVYAVWKKDRVWDMTLTDGEIDAVCNDEYLEEKYRHVESWIKAQ